MLGINETCESRNFCSKFQSILYQFLKSHKTCANEGPVLWFFSLKVKKVLERNFLPSKISLFIIKSQLATTVYNRWNDFMVSFFVRYENWWHSAAGLIPFTAHVLIIIARIMQNSSLTNSCLKNEIKLFFGTKKTIIQDWHSLHTNRNVADLLLQGFKG